MGGIRVDLNAVGVRVAQNVPGVLHDGELHAQAQSQEGLFLHPGIADGTDLSLDPPGAEAAGHQDSLAVAQELPHIFRGDGLRVHPFDLDGGVVFNATVL